jgi:pSer/pThr/pTyr-binding forkhead associated (FHA) protein
MVSKVVLTAIAGRLKGREFVFRKTTRCVAGRAPDCYLHVPDPMRTVSRHHCLFEIDPPYLTVRDLGSLNGTYVNGEEIANRHQHDLAEGRSLRDGDMISLGNTIFEVSVLELYKDDHSDSDEIEPCLVSC